MIADMHSNEKLNPIVTELFIRGGDLFIRLNSTLFPYKNSKQKRASTNRI